MRSFEVCESSDTPESVTLLEETLMDGSKVYAVQFVPTGATAPVVIDCSCKRDACILFDFMTGYHVTAITQD